MASIFGVGIATVDVINRVTSFPKEDSEVRAFQQLVCRGGNVCNTLTVLSQFSHDCYWSGVICDDKYAHFIRDDLRENQIDLSFTQPLSFGSTPTSYITLNQTNGSRTIVHYRDLPELSSNFFQTLNLRCCDWFHFEARAIDETCRMVAHVKHLFPRATISIEVEKEREGLEQIFGLANLYLFSRAFAQHMSFENPVDFLASQAVNSPHADLICSWGELGATGLLANGVLIESPAFPSKVIDTLGAGDTFNAGIIHARLKGLNWKQALTLANKLAGKKCAQEGFSRLAQQLNMI